jgi:hypothetical protein
MAQGGHVTNRRRLTTLAIALTMFSLPVSDQEKLTERTFRLKPGEKSPPAAIGDMAWLAGGWVKRSAACRRRSGASLVRAHDGNVSARARP